MLRLVERGYFRATEIALKLDEKGMPATSNPDVQVLRCGSFDHPKYGYFQITTATLQEMKANFDNKVRGIDVAFDYFHNSDQEASGWPTELYLSEDQQSLWAKVDWTKVAIQKLSEREIRYFSPDFAFEWQDPETKQTFKNVLFGGGLTNRPFVKDMAAIVAAEGTEMTLEEAVAKMTKLSEDGNKQMEKIMAENAAMKKQLDDMMAEKPPGKGAPAPANAGSDADADSDEDDNDEDDNDVDSLKKKLGEAKKQLAEKSKVADQAKQAAQLAEKEKDFNVMLSEGKACVAQKDAFMKGDMKKFVSLSQKINLSENGSSANRENDGLAREDKVLKLAEEKCKADKNLDMGTALSIANKEIAKD